MSKREVLILIIGIFLAMVVILILSIVVFGEIDAEESCKGMSLKQCYKFCKSQTFLLSQDCNRIIRDLDETRQILGGEE